MEEYELAKQKGQERANPDKKRSWKVLRKIGRGRTTYFSQMKKQYKVQIRELTKKEILEENKPSFLIEVPIKWKEFPYCPRAEFLTEDQTVKYYKAKRSGRYCKKCDTIFCHHRCVESALVVLASKAKNSGAFMIFPKDVVKIIARFIYEMQVEHNNHVDFFLQNPYLYDDI